MAHPRAEWLFERSRRGVLESLAARLLADGIDVEVRPPLPLRMWLIDAAAAFGFATDFCGCGERRLCAADGAHRRHQGERARGGRGLLRDRRLGGDVLQSGALQQSEHAGKRSTHRGRGGLRNGGGGSAGSQHGGRGGLLDLGNGQYNG